MRHYAPAPLDRALPFLTQLAGAIDFARAAGIGHGGLHLRDVFVTPDEARASGFGIVEALERVGVRAPVRRPYSAPERIAGGEWGTPADVFSLAAIAYELIAARRPSGTGEQIGELTGEHIANHASAIRSVLARAMADQPARRYSTALGFAAALEAAARTGVPDTAAAVTVPAPAVATEELRPTRPAEEPVVPVAATAAAIDHAEKEPIGDDIAVERDADAAHHVMMREAEEEAAHTLFDAAEEESAADHALDEAAVAADHSERWKFDGRSGGDDIAPGVNSIRPRREERAYAPALRDDVLTTPVERPRPSILPQALGWILCLLIGFAIGYSVAGRESPEPAAATVAEAPKPSQPAPSQSQAAPGRAYSEQAVVPPATGRDAAERGGASGTR